MSIKSKVKDLLQELDANYPLFKIKNGVLYDSADGDAEGVVKITMCKHTGNPIVRVHVSKAGSWICSDPIDVERLDDISERMKISNVLDEVRVLLLT